MLLRCLDTDTFALPDGQPRSAAAVAQQLARGSDPQNPPELQLLLPAARCLVTTVPVTKRDARLLVRTLPWMLEDRLIEPAEALHFASAPLGKDLAAVSAVNREWLDAVLATLAAAGLHPHAVMSELLRLPWQPDQWTVHVPATLEQPCLVRHAAHAGFACARGNLQTGLQLLLNETGAAPARLLVYAESAATFVAGELLPALLQSRLQLSETTYWATLLPDAAAPPACNLLQGAFAPRLPLARWWQAWRMVAMLLAALLIADVGLALVETGKVSRQIAGNETALLELYRQVQPEGVVVDPQLQLQQAVAGLGGSVHPGFLSLFSRIAPALAAQPDAHVRSLEYNDSTGALGLLVETEGFSAAENLRVKLQALGLRAELLGSSSDGTRSVTRLQVGS